MAQRPGDRHKVSKHTLRSPDDLWERFARKVTDDGRTQTAVLLWLIRRWLDED